MPDGQVYLKFDIDEQALFHEALREVRIQVPDIRWDPDIRKQVFSSQFLELAEDVLAELLGFENVVTRKIVQSDEPHQAEWSLAEDQSRDPTDPRMTPDEATSAFYAELEFQGPDVGPEVLGRHMAVEDAYRTLGLLPNAPPRVVDCAHRELSVLAASDAELEVIDRAFNLLRPPRRGKKQGR